MTSDSFPGRAGTIVAGRYRLERELGAGGMGEVYVAIQEPLGRQVALKLMRAGLTGAAAQRFEREAKSLAATTHPNIVTLFDYGRTDDGELFMVMELLPGMTLRAHVARRGRLAPAEALPIVVDICRALEATHRCGIVHRDLKPENVMLVDVGGGATIVKVLDFGIASLQDVPDGDARLTQTGHLVGTPGYMAPETVLEGVLDDPRSDLYAVGVILWEMLTNHPLFQALTPIALVMKHALEPPPTLTATLSLTTPPHPALEGLLARLLHKDRHQRFQRRHRRDWRPAEGSPGPHRRRRRCRPGAHRQHRPLGTHHQPNAGAVSDASDASDASAVAPRCLPRRRPCRHQRRRAR